ncbi:PP2C family protein-serine/threonine phosphatase [Cellulomonas sp. McL0617]|uniref:PP2C family protein-serine/threonine phosphatase n=1 Tax=Cellulomonas sp. McL0617 TaxID=3415675 RepID=UPI003CEB05BD
MNDRAEAWDVAPVALLRLDPDGLIADANRVLLSWVGRDADDVIGRIRLSDLLSAGGRIYWETHLSPLLHMQDRVDEVAVELRAPSGRFPVLMSAVVRPSDGSVDVALSAATERARYERELRSARAAAEVSLDQKTSVAHELQRALLTMPRLDDDRFVVTTEYRPGVQALEVGGDWYDAFLVDDGTLALVVGDVVGRGLRAATDMGQLRSAIRALAEPGVGPARLLSRLDRFVEQTGAGFMATTAYAEVALATGVVTYACAGHLPPLLLGAGAPRFLWDGRSMPLGFPGRTRLQATVSLGAGDRLALYTDGLVERRDRPLDDGLGSLAATLDSSRRPLPDLVSELLVHTGDDRDDVCLLLLEWFG